MSAFERLSEEILESFWRSSPCAATFAGIHKYDHLLDNVDRDYLLSANRERKDFLQRLVRLDETELNQEEKIDWQLLKNSLQSSIKDFEEIRQWQKNAAGYANIVNALGILFLREFAPIEERAQSILSRMKQIPRFLEDSKRNLQDAPEVFTELAIDVNEGGRIFLGTVEAKLSRYVPALASDLEKAYKLASDAMLAYGSFLKSDLLPRSTGEFAVGATQFNFKLKFDHMLPYAAEEILQYGYEIKRLTEDNLMQIAREIDAHKTWLETVEDIKNQHPPASELLATYEREMERAKRFVQDNDLVTIPYGEELEVICTPEFLRPVFPYAAYLNPAAFEPQQKGHFFVTPVDESLPVEQQSEVLRGHPLHGIPVIALHEAYPGHHLQLVHANRLKRKLRRLLSTTVFVEGWALYCEEMMYDAGFYPDPSSRLMQLKDQLWRACRVIIDVGLHTKKMTYEQAVDLLVNDAKLQKVHAEKEVTRYAYTPTQPMSYLIGKKQILDLRSDYQNKVGAGFKLKEFHDQLLSFGSIPICLIRQALGL